MNPLAVAPVLAVAAASVAAQHDTVDLQIAEKVVHWWSAFPSSASLAERHQPNRVRHPLRAAEQLEQRAARYRAEAGPFLRHHTTPRPRSVSDSFTAQLDEADRRKHALWQLVEDSIHARKAADSASALAAALRFVFHTSQRRSISLLAAS